MTKARIYIVTNPFEGNAPPRLVRAISQSQALKAVTRPYQVRVATTDEMAELLPLGVRVENAFGGEPA